VSLAGGIDADTRYQQFDHLPFHHSVLGPLDVLQPIPEANQ
jgi:hypothetical protein